MSRKNMPAKKDILRYWSSPTPEFEEFEIEINPSNPDCFACGDYLQVQRCHISPVNKGGSNDVSNIHLLCNKCHAESEDMTGDAYWKWLQYMNHEKFETSIKWVLLRLQGTPDYWAERIMEISDDRDLQAKYGLATDELQKFAFDLSEQTMT